MRLRTPFSRRASRPSVGFSFVRPSSRDRRRRRARGVKPLGEATARELDRTRARSRRSESPSPHLRDPETERSLSEARASVTNDDGDRGSSVTHGTRASFSLRRRGPLCVASLVHERRTRFSLQAAPARGAAHGDPGRHDGARECPARCDRVAHERGGRRAGPSSGRPPLRVWDRLLRSATRSARARGSRASLGVRSRTVADRRRAAERANSSRRSHATRLLTEANGIACGLPVSARTIRSCARRRASTRGEPCGTDDHHVTSARSPSTGARR